MNKIEFGDCRETMRKWKDQGIKAQTCVTSPPYFGLRDYGHDGQIGLEETPEQYISAMVEVFRCVWDVLEDDGTLWLNIGDSYAGNNSRASNNGRAGFGNPRDKVVNSLHLL
jgi:DNA modification methylase